MISRWTAHLKTDDEKERFKASVKNSSFVIDRLKTIIEEDLAQIERLAISMEDYQSPSWAYVQADRNGAARQMIRILKLLNLDQKDDNALTIRRPE